MPTRRSRATLFSGVTILLAGLLLTSVHIIQAGATGGDSDGHWFTEEAGNPADSTSENTEASRFSPLDADQALSAVVTPQDLAGAVAGERTIVAASGDLTATLFDGEEVTVTIEEVALTLGAEGLDTVPTVEVVGTHLEADGDREAAAFTFVPDEAGNYALHGGIDRGEASRVEVEPAADGLVRLIEVDAAVDLPGETDDALLAPADDADSPVPTPEAIPPEAGEEDIITVDLLIGYVSTLGSPARGAIAHRVTETNAALATSRTRVRLSLVSTTPVKYTPEPTMRKDLDNIQEESSALAPLRDQRDAIGADLVALVVPSATRTECGLAWVPPSSGSPDYAFSVTAFDCLRGLTLSHEIGHNLGGNHDRAHTTISNHPFPFSHGHQVPGKARDVMAYACLKGDCPRKLQFSNPDVPFIGFPRVRSGTPDDNNARSFDLMAPIIEQYRERTGIVRVAGKDRYETAAAASQHAFTDPVAVSTVVVATGTDFPDALSAAPLAAKLGGPLLLSTSRSLSPATEAEIRRLQPDHIIMLGGPGALSPMVERALRQLLPENGAVERISGVDRYATSLALAERGWPTATDAFLATGADYADALSASAAAGHLDAPVLLVPQRTASLPASARSYLESAGTTRIHIAGGPSIVSPGVESDAKRLGSVVRYAGKDRYETSAEIANAHHTVGGSIYFASGSDFPDALSGAAVAAQAHAPLVLSARTCVLQSLNAVQRSIQPRRLVLLGGTALLSEAVRQGQVCV